MSRSKIITISIYTVAAVVILYFAYGVVKSRYFSNGGSEKAVTPSSQEQSGGASVENNSGDQAVQEDQDNSNLDGGQESTDNQNANLDGSHLDVTSKDCDKNCDRWKDNADDLKYCQEVCGIIPATHKESKEECSNLDGLERDYCLRDVAVSKKDTGICEEIKDSKVKKVCKSRVVEEILD
jgi:hypothetical protein